MHLSIFIQQTNNDFNLFQANRTENTRKAKIFLPSRLAKD
jgi:hypothetical protein